MIVLENAEKLYKGRQKETRALHKICLKIEQGEFVAVMGASGSGKTTLLKLLGGIEPLTEGAYYFNDIPVHTMDSERLAGFRRAHVGFVFQNYNLLDDCTVYENLELPLRLKNIGKKDRKNKIDEMLQLLQIGQYAKVLPSHLSGGEQQRCAIARAVIAENELLLADEPTGALDSLMGREVMELMTRLHRERRLTIVMVTHDEKVARRAERIIYINDGEIVI